MNRSVLGALIAPAVLAGLVLAGGVASAAEAPPVGSVAACTAAKVEAARAQSDLTAKRQAAKDAAGAVDDARSEGQKNNAAAKKATADTLAAVNANYPLGKDPSKPTLDDEKKRLSDHTPQNPANADDQAFATRLALVNAAIKARDNEQATITKSRQDFAAAQAKQKAADDAAAAAQKALTEAHRKAGLACPGYTPPAPAATTTPAATPPAATPGASAAPAAGGSNTGTGQNAPQVSQLPAAGTGVATGDGSTAA